jgi:hypothetical protein
MYILKKIVRNLKIKNNIKLEKLKKYFDKIPKN